eukprot:XP_027314674.1 copine-8 isoform X1 [Anas platyrhynchos]
MPRNPLSEQMSPSTQPNPPRAPLEVKSVKLGAVSPQTGHRAAGGGRLSRPCPRAPWRRDGAATRWRSRHLGAEPPHGGATTSRRSHRPPLPAATSPRLPPKLLLAPRPLRRRLPLAVAAWRCGEGRLAPPPYLLPSLSTLSLLHPLPLRAAPSMFGLEKPARSGGFPNMASVGDFNALSSSIPATKVELSVSCRNLLDRDTFSKSDPICVLYTQAIGNKEWREFGRTEVIDNTLNPDFVRKFIMDYFFEERENLRFDFYDVDSKSPNLSKHDFLGQMFCTLGEIVGSQGSRLEKPIVGIPGKKCGTVIVTAEELGCCRDSVLMQFCANKLDKKDFFGKSDPFLVFHRSNEDGSFTICHKTEVVKNTLNPVWQAFKISVRALCNGDYDRTIKVEVYDWDRDGSHDFIGEFTTSYRELSRGQSQFNVYEVSILSIFTCFQKINEKTSSNFMVN